MIWIVVMAFLMVALGIAILFGLVYAANRIDEMFERRRKDETDITG